MKHFENFDGCTTKRNKLTNNLIMRILIVFSLTMISITSVVANDYEGYYVTNNLDTIKCRIGLSENPFYKGVYLFQRISERVRLIDAEGRKKFRPQEIAGFVLFLPDGDNCKFVSVPTDNRYFYREMASGEITMYFKYMSHPYDRGMITECVLFKNNVPVVLGYMSSRRKQREKINLLLSDKPEVLAKWEAAEFSLDTLQEVIKEYNK